VFNTADAMPSASSTTWSFVVFAFCIAVAAADTDPFAAKASHLSKTTSAPLTSNTTANATACGTIEAPSAGLGYVAAFVAVKFFGSNFVPVKQYETHDGVFYQWAMCTGVFLVGNIVNAYQGYPKFEAIAMLGGALWSTGNVLSVAIIKLIGLSLGLLIWGSTNMLVGWASGTFGLFGLNARAVGTPALNYAGVCVALVSLALYILITPAEDPAELLKELREAEEERTGLRPDSTVKIAEVDAKIENLKARITELGHDADLEEGLTAAGEYDDGRQHQPRSRSESREWTMREDNDMAGMLPGTGSRFVRNPHSGSQQDLTNIIDDAIKGDAGHDVAHAAQIIKERIHEKTREEIEKSWIDTLPSSSKRSIGVALAAVAGLLYGATFDPPQWVIDNRGPTSESGMKDCANAASGDVKDYIFPHFCGIWLTSTIWFIIYIMAMKNKPAVNPQVILPAFISGIMWGIAQVSWFVANSALSFAVSFPIVTSGPGFIAAMWGVFAFGEITGKRNYIVLGCAFVTTVTAGLLIAMSS